MANEGLLVGGSSGSALAGALEYLRPGGAGDHMGQTKGLNVVIILPDGLVHPSWALGTCSPWLSQIEELHE